MAGPGDIHDAQIPLPDSAIEVSVDEVETRGRAPVAEQPRLDVFRPQRLTKEWIVEQVDLADREIVGGTPVGIETPKLICGEDGPPLDGTGPRHGRFDDRHESTSLSHHMNRARVTRRLHFLLPS
jgi:hypothetical protein